MNIKPSASIRQNYNDIAELCRSTGEPVYLTKNGEGDRCNGYQFIYKTRKNAKSCARNCLLLRKTAYTVHRTTRWMKSLP